MIKLTGSQVLPPMEPTPKSAPKPPTSKPATSKPKASTTAKPVKGERFKMLNKFVDYDMASLTGAETRVWLKLFRDTKQDGIARTGMSDIATRTGLSRRHVMEAVKKLVAKKRIEVVSVGTFYSGPSEYRVL